MEKILFIIIIICFENNNYNNIEIIEPKGYTFIVNKNNKLNDNYIPNDLEKIDIKYSTDNKYLRHKAKIAFEKLAKQAYKDGYNIVAVSTYRSYKYQENLFNNYVKELGYYSAIIGSAKAGHSEHQTGLAIDVADTSLDYNNFINTKEYKWMINNAYKYGFILRYPKAKYHITGFKFEPWHYRYVGIKLATYLHKDNITLEEYYNLSN